MGSVADLNNVSVVRDGRRILGPIDLTIREGESVAVIGPNGSGKTTLSLLIRGEIRPYYDEDDPCGYSIMGERDPELFRIRRSVASVSSDDERMFSSSMTVSEVILTGCFGSDAVYPTDTVTTEMERRAHEISEMLHIGSISGREFGTLSQGERKKVMIARALMPDPDSLVLDEPANSLDPSSKAEFRDMIKELIGMGISVILVTHDIGDIPEGMERVIGMKDGRIEFDGMKSDVLTSDRLSELFGIPVQVDVCGGIYALRTRPTKV